VASAIDKLSSFENLYIIATVVEIVTGEEILPGTPNDVYELIDWFRSWWKGTSVESGILMQIAEAFTNITPGPFDDIILGGIQAGGLTPGFNPGWTDPGMAP